MQTAPIRSAFVLAAGFGKRMGELTATRPKPLLPVDGAPLLAHSLFRLREWGVERVIVNTHYRAKQIAAILEDCPGLEIHVSHEPEILGTAGGLRRVLRSALPDPDEPIALLNPDTLLLPGPADAPRAPRPEIDTVLYLHPRAPDSEVTGFAFQGGDSAEEDALIRMDSQGGWFYGGYAILRPRITAELPPDSFAELGPLWGAAGERKRLAGRVFSGQALDAGTRDAYLQIRDAAVVQHAERKRWLDFLAAWPSLASLIGAP